MFTKITLPALLILSLGACTQTASGVVSTRNTAAPASAHTAAAHGETQMTQQTAALANMTQDIVRKSTTKGIAIGAIAGCGLAVVSASNAKNCVSGALIGGIAGGIAGNAQGKKEAKRRVELVSPSALVRSIGKASKQMNTVSRDLPTLLASQETEMKTLEAQRKTGKITAQAHETRVSEIKQNREALAETLTLNAAQASEAHKNLKNAAAQGQTGLEWHINATEHLQNESLSARSAISLL